MVKRVIIWTEKANHERKEILEYWINRNKSKSFSIKLNKLIIQELICISIPPGIGRKTNYKNIQVKIIRDYLLFYEIRKDEIVVLTIWDNRRNPENLSLK